MTKLNKVDKYSRKTHKLLKRKCFGSYACDGCYVCAGVKTARYSKREIAVLTEKVQYVD